jgi:polygalacturonase
MLEILEDGTRDGSGDVNCETEPATPRRCLSVSTASSSSSSSSSSSEEENTRSRRAAATSDMGTEADFGIEAGEAARDAVDAAATGAPADPVVSSPPVTLT